MNKSITLSTTAGELIPEGKYCEGCIVLCHWPDMRSWCKWFPEYKLIKDHKAGAYKKHRACPKPPSEVKK